jgi:WD40 repeat protein
MFGRTAFVFGLAAALIGVAWWLTLLGRSNDRPNPTADGPFAYGELLYPAVELPAPPEIPAPFMPADLNAFPDFSIHSLDVTNVPAQAEGQILFIGTIVDEKAVGKYSPGEVKKVEIYRGGKKEPFFYRRLKETDQVVENQVLGMINPARAFDKLAVAEANLEVAQEEAAAAEAVHKTAKEEWNRAKAGSQGNPPAISRSELAIRALEADKAFREMLAKRSKIKAAQSEVYSAQTEASWYVIRNPLPGVSVIKAIDKKAGDAAKNLDTVLQLQNRTLLRAEGMVDVSYLNRVLARKGMKVRVEPTYEEAPLRELIRHRKEVTGVAVGRTARGPVVVSGSLDRSVVVWDAATGKLKNVLDHPEMVRAVATAPAESARNWLLSACGDGSVRLWDLDDVDGQPAVVADSPHHDAVTALAFSPDGKYFATGGADNLICLWRTEGAKLVYRLDAEHGVDNTPQGQVTSLAFTPQCRLVAAGRDNTLRVWELCVRGARPVRTVPDRGGTVGQLGVSHDGRTMLLDQGKTLQVLSIPEGRTVGLVRKPTTATPFETLALYSPDSRLILTGGAAEGRLQLWHVPTPSGRAFEVRVLSPGDRSGTTCAAFSPAGVTVEGKAFAVSGTREGQVLLWPLPTAKQVEEAPVAGTLMMVDTALEPGARQARVGVEIDNADNRLNPGKQATVVISP